MDTEATLMRIAESLSRLETKLNVMFPEGTPPCAVQKLRLDNLEKWRSRILSIETGLFLTVVSMIIREYMNG